MQIVGWQEFQGYRKRGPRWIKLHTSIIDQPQFLALPLVARAILPVLWVTAARLSHDGSLPDDIPLLATLAHCSQDELRKALEPLRQAGFIDCDKTVAVVATRVSPQREGEREGEGETYSGADAPVPWSRQACEDWISRFGGTAPGGQIGKALKPLVERHGWPVVQKAWRSYLEQSEAEYANPARFASTFGSWTGTAAKGKPTVADKTKANLAAWVAGKEAGS